jgi:small subunit ribosomal protein S1
MIENEDLDTAGSEENDGESFAELFEKSATRTNWLEPGQKLTARVLKISDEWIFIDTGQKGEGVVDRKEFLDLDGNITVKEGDSITAYFLSSNHGEMSFTTKLGGGASGSAQLEDAWRSGVPVEGLVEKEIKAALRSSWAELHGPFAPFLRLHSDVWIIPSR